MKKSININYIELVVLLAMMTAIGALTIDLQLPAMPEILASFGMQESNQQQWIVTSYMFGYAAAQIFYGPISDVVGRKPVFLFGLLIYVIASAICLWVDNYLWFLVARGFQGVGAAGARIMANAITRDLFVGNEMAKVTSLITIIFIMVPVFAPLLGSVLITVGPWHWVLMAFLIFGILILVWSWWRMPESLESEQRRQLRWPRLKESFLAVVCQPLSMTFALVSGVIFSGFMAYINSAEQIFSQVYDAKHLFPYLFGGIALFFGLSAFINAKVVEKLGAIKVTYSALIVLSVILSVFVLLTHLYNGLPPLWVFVLMLACVNVFIGLVFGNLMAIAMLPLGQNAGMGASVIGMVSTLIAATLGMLISQQLGNNVWPIVLGFAVTGVLALALVARYRNTTMEELEAGLASG